jgi:hypothetical protein
MSNPCTANEKGVNQAIMATKTEAVAGRPFVGSMLPEARLPATGIALPDPPKKARNPLTWLIAGEVIVRAAYAELARSRAAAKCVRIVGWELISEIRVLVFLGSDGDNIKSSS